ncbi:MAG: GntR family transcriptional regulator [Clostridia bacterium]|nr:GntR family transcriptional regulator [Clostridia bacterium]
MIDFERFTMEDGTPIYLQIILYIKRGAVAGSVRDGDELPSRRVLSARLGVNPNTVQKAYRTLEEEGLIVSHAGAKSYVALSPERLARIREELLAQDARSVIAAMRQMGLGRAEALALIEKYWEE